MKNEDNLRAWMDQGMPSDLESLEEFHITTKQIKKLRKRVMELIAEKMLSEPGKIVSPQHRTIQ